MTDQQPTPMDIVESRHAMAGVAMMVRAFYMNLTDEGFTEVEAMKLTSAYVSGLARIGT